MAASHCKGFLATFAEGLAESSKWISRLLGGELSLPRRVDDGFAAVFEAQEIRRYQAIQDGVYFSPAVLRAVWSGLGGTATHYFLDGDGHIDCAVCPKANQIRMNHHETFQVAYFHEANIGDPSRAYDLEPEFLVDVAALAASGAAALVTGDLSFSAPPFAVGVESRSLVQQLLQYLPQVEWSATQARWLNAILSPARDNDESFKELLIGEFERRPNEFRSLARWMGVAALQLIQSHPRLFPYVPLELAQDLAGLREGRLSAERASEIWLRYMHDFREIAMVRQVLDFRPGGFATSHVAIRFGALHTPGVYWLLRRSLDLHGSAGVPISVDPHAKKHMGKASAFIDPILNLEARR